MRLKLTIEYDGTSFRGWAAQPELRTVEAELRSSLASVFGPLDNLAVAGRTDTGVHALGNVVSFDVDGGPPAERAAEALNAALPADVAVIAAESAAGDFHARHSARSRSYRYRIWRRRTPSPFELRRSWWYPRPVDEQRLADAADLLLGLHDFRAFTPTETQHEVFNRNVVRAQWHRRGRCARVRDHRRQLSPAHGADTRRHNAGDAAGANRPAARGPPARSGGHDRSAAGPLPRTR